MLSSESRDTTRYHVPLSPVQVAIIAVALSYAEERADSPAEISEIITLKAMMRRLLVD